MTAAGGSVLHQARFLPFGGTRGWAGAATTPWLDRGYTGHLHNDSAGLIYMNARYYVPSLGRFASADTIVPNPANPQSMNRFSYVRNNPLKFIDPTGHYECYANNICADTLTRRVPTRFSSTTPLVKFSSVTGESWTTAEKQAIQHGAWQAAKALYDNGTFASPRDAFLETYGNSVTWHKTGKSCKEATGDNLCYAQVQTGQLIHIFTDIYDKDGVSKIPNANTSDRWAVHELGHAFESRVNGAKTWGYVRKQLPDNIANRNGFAGGYPGWQQSTCTVDCKNEIFADMFVGWTYQKWETNPTTGGLSYQASLKDTFMTTNMSMWINIASTRP